MPIIMISSVSHCSAEELAQDLGRKTGWPTLSRRQLADDAHAQGIKLGRLETSIIKKPINNERLAREKDIYLAYITAAICEKARDGNLVYEGRAGHLLLPGVRHRLRVGLMAPKEARIEKAIADLNLPREKVSSYLDQIDEDFEKWVHYVHKAEWRDPALFDFFINLQTISLSHASDLLVNIASLPDYCTTTETRRAMGNHHLTAKAKLRLETDDRTRRANFWVRAVDGTVTVTYMPGQKGIDHAIIEVLEQLEGCNKVQCTMAETNVLWVQERFHGVDENFQHITQIAQRWGAAVELLQIAPRSGSECDECISAAADEIRNPTADNGPAVYTGGVEDDGPEVSPNDSGLGKVMEELVSIGRSGGGKTVYGGSEEIMEAVKNATNCSLVVLGDIFLDKGNEARKRQARELALNVRERFKIPVVTGDEIRSRFFFDSRQAVKLVACALAVICIYAAAFRFQDVIMNFLGGPMHQNAKVISAICVVLFVPLVAYLYGTVTGLLFKLIGVD
jgi:hypothetical protein